MGDATVTSTFASPEDAVAALIAYALDRELLAEEDITYATNLVLDAIKLEPAGSFVPLDAVERARATEPRPLEEILVALLDDAVARGVIEDGIASRDLLDTRIMGCVTPRPSEVIRTFAARYEESPERATDYLYKLALDSDYIRSYRIARDRKWTVASPYGTMDITINLSKPEKDPRAIAAALARKADAEPYPRCQLCPENEGYAGRLDHPARETIRLIPLTLAGEPWYLQYSPYVYYNEHCIVLAREHVPMRIDRTTFQRLFEFIERFPHYTIGSNADLPIVGGSILTHEHYQGGRYEFAMARADVREQISFPGYEDVQAGIVRWPMSVIRLDGEDPARIIELADRVLTTWRGYSDASCEILAETDGVPHNTITPIARRRGKLFELDLVLRNNRTTPEHPLGLFHPHAELHHIKKENIGLIEVMGLAVLPARLLGEMTELERVILAGGDPAAETSIASHAPWAREVLERHPSFAPAEVGAYVARVGDKAAASELEQIIEQEIGQVFVRVLEQCAVFPDTETGRAGMARFIEQVR